MSRVITVLCAVTGLCCTPRRDPPQGSVGTVSQTLTASAPRSAAPVFEPAPHRSASATTATEIPAPSPDRIPLFEAGPGVLRLGVMYSRQEADVKRIQLSKIVRGKWPLIEARPTESRDSRVTHRLQIGGVAPGAAVALCDWLQQYKGWHPGAAECALRGQLP